MKTLHIAVACRNASGVADLPVFAVHVTAEEYDLGIHYDIAEAMVAQMGYERPFVCFDPSEQNAIVSAGRTLQAFSEAAG